MSDAQHCPRCGQSFLGRGVQGLCPRCLGDTAFALDDEPGSGAGAPESPDPSKLRYFGDYELIEEIARGGMGVVFKARQVSLNRTVAVKMLLFGRLTGADFVKRFRAEAEAAASLQHPNIVAIHEVGEHEGQPYFSMDYIRGLNLSELPRDQPLPARRAAALLRTVAEAVHYAHERGVLHRDLKPANILIDAEGQPRVTDFGLAKRLSSFSRSTEVGSEASGQPFAAGDPTFDLTLSGQILGTPGFMSPEQAGGRRGAVGPASDVYSLGALLYFLLTNRAPFAAESLEETLRQVHETEPVSPRLLNPNVPRDLETICLKCLSKEPSRRYAGAQELALDLGCFIHDEPIRARPLSRFGKLWRWCRRKPALAALIVALHLVGAAGLAGILWQWRQAKINATVEAQQRRRAEMAEQIATEKLREAYLAQARAARFSSQPGRRFESLSVLAKAASVAGPPGWHDTLRNEAIACLALSDVRVLWSQTNFPPDTTSVAFDRSLERYAVGWNDTGEISVRRLGDDQELLRLPALTNALHEVLCFSPDGRWLAARYDGNETRAWDLTRSESIRVGPGAAPYNGSAADFRPGADELAVADGSGAITILHLPSGNPRATFRLPFALRPNQVRYSPDGARLAALEQESSADVVVLDATSGQTLTRIQPPQRVRNFAWDGAGRRLALALWNRSFHLWDAHTGEQREGPFIHHSDVDGVAFTLGDGLLLTSAWDGTAVWDYRNGERLMTIAESRQAIHISTDGRRFIRQLYHGGSFELCELAWGSPALFVGSTEPATEQAGEHCAVFSPDGQLLALATGNRLNLFDALDGRELARVAIAGARSLVFDHRTNLWLTGQHGCQRWPLRAGDGGGHWTLGPPEYLGPALTMGRAAASADCRTVAVCGGGSVLVFDTETAALQSRTPPSRWEYLYVSMSGAGRWAAAAPWRPTELSVFDASNGALVYNVPTLGAAAVAFSPDESRLFVSVETLFCMLETGTWQRLWTKPRKLGIPAAAFSPDGTVLAQREDLACVQLNDADTGERVALLTWPGRETVERLAFSTDSTRLAVVFLDTRQAVVWDLRELRRELAVIGLDWGLPAYPARDPGLPPRPIELEIIEDTPERLGELRAAAMKAIGPRDPRADASLLDLEPHFNLALTDPWFPSAPGRANSFSELPQGLVRFAGTEFDVRGIVQLAGKAAIVRDYPGRTADIRVGRRCRFLHALHGTRNVEAEGTRIGRLVIHYADGRQREWPLVYGRDVRDFWKRSNEPESPASLLEAWAGHNADATANGASGIRVFKSTWDNPLPGVPIASIDFESDLTRCEPFLVALTAEP